MRSSKRPRLESNPSPKLEPNSVEDDRDYKAELRESAEHVVDICRKLFTARREIDALREERNAAVEEAERAWGFRADETTLPAKRDITEVYAKEKNARTDKGNNEGIKDMKSAEQETRRRKANGLLFKQFISVKATCTLTAKRLEQEQETTRKLRAVLANYKKELRAVKMNTDTGKSDRGNDSVDDDQQQSDIMGLQHRVEDLLNEMEAKGAVIDELQKVVTDGYLELTDGPEQDDQMLESLASTKRDYSDLLERILCWANSHLDKLRHTILRNLSNHQAAIRNFKLFLTDNQDIVPDPRYPLEEGYFLTAVIMRYLQREVFFRNDLYDEWRPFLDTFPKEGGADQELPGEVYMRTFQEEGFDAFFRDVVAEKIARALAQFLAFCEGEGEKGGHETLVVGLQEHVVLPALRLNEHFLSFTTTTTTTPQQQQQQRHHRFAFAREEALASVAAELRDRWTYPHLEPLFAARDFIVSKDASTLLSDVEQHQQGRPTTIDLRQQTRKEIAHRVRVISAFAPGLEVQQVASDGAVVRTGLVKPPTWLVSWTAKGHHRRLAAAQGGERAPGCPHFSVGGGEGPKAL